MEKVYKNHLITRDRFTGYYSARTKNGRVMADTLKGIKELINQNL
jgi:hypothetical protein